jgi:hypothetical protein
VKVKILIKFILVFFSSNFNFSDSCNTVSGNFSFNQASIISDSISIQGLSLLHNTSKILHSGLFHSHFVIFIATLSLFFIFLKFSNFLNGIKISFLNKRLSNITKAYHFFNSIVQTRILSALFITLVITASSLLLKTFTYASTSSQSKAHHEFFG